MLSASVPKGQWFISREDPVLHFLSGKSVSWEEKLNQLFPRLQGQPAFDPEEVVYRQDKGETSPPGQTPYLYLNLAIKTGLVFIYLTFQGGHPRYGAKHYTEEQHAAFPPTIIATVDALTAWGLSDKAKRFFRYWVTHFIRKDGTIDYYGPSLSEDGQILHTAALLLERAGPENWWAESYPSLQPLVNYLISLRQQAENEDRLLTGGPEDNEKEKVGKYFHYNAWVSRGLYRWVLAYQAPGNPVKESTRNSHC
ncbi:MAG: hypothetical protein NC911_04135 [Candidatus Omnitrophica bacterium]|nr:hypothetical protein [Candidatus Omnitrophota bacterium]